VVSVVCTKSRSHKFVRARERVWVWVLGVFTPSERTTNISSLCAYEQLFDIKSFFEQLKFLDNLE